MQTLPVLYMNKWQLPHFILEIWLFFFFCLVFYSLSFTGFCIGSKSRTFNHVALLCISHDSYSEARYTIAPYLTSIRWESLIFLLYMNSLLELRYCHQRFNFHLLLTHDVFSHRFQWNFFTKLNFFSLPRLYMQHILYIDLITSLHVLCKSWMSHNTLIRH